MTQNCLTNLVAPASTDPLAIYIHWPFCLSKCPYCDFNSYVSKNIDSERFILALQTELTFEATRLGKKEIGSIYFGGGTPSLMPPAGIEVLIDQISRSFYIIDECEITLEVNPTRLEINQLQDFAQAGINRLSLGVQSLYDDALHMLGRKHSAGDAINALLACRQRFDKVSFDLIYVRPGQTIKKWERELNEALSLSPDHLSLYQLTIEPGTRFSTLWKQGRMVLPHESVATSLYETTVSTVEKHGLSQYEISNYARKGHESRHNLTYWRYGDYLGIGPGAHSRLTLDGNIWAIQRQRLPESWANFVEKNGSAINDIECLTIAQRCREMLLMGLRLNEIFSATRFYCRTGALLEKSIDTDTLKNCLDAGYLKKYGNDLAVTAAGQIRLDSLLSMLIL